MGVEEQKGNVTGQCFTIISLGHPKQNYYININPLGQLAGSLQHT